MEIRPSGKKVFLFLFQWEKKPQTITLGNYPSLSLADARIKATSHRDLLNKEVDPRKGDVNEQSKPTFREVADQIEVIIDEILEIADDTSNDSVISEEDGKLIIDHEHINRSRLKIDTRKWLAAKLCPRLYGDKNERITLRFPRDINANSLLPMSSEVFRALANQEITPEHARTVIGAIKNYSATIIIGDLNSRLAQLELQISTD